MFFDITNNLSQNVVRGLPTFIPLFESGNLSPGGGVGVIPLGDKFRKLIFDRVSQPAPLLQDEVFAQIQFIFAVREVITKRNGAGRTFYIKDCQCLISQLSYYRTLSAASLILLIGFRQCRLQKRLFGEVCKIVKF